MGRGEKIKTSKEPPIKEVCALHKPPKNYMSPNVSSSLEGVISLTLPHETSCLTLVLEEAHGYTYTKFGFVSPYLRMLFFLTILGELSLQS
jgi:hypothetical protein